MKLHQLVLSFYVWLVVLLVLLLLCVPVTGLVRLYVLPFLLNLLFQEFPLAIRSALKDPLLAVSALVVVLFGWSLICTLMEVEPATPTTPPEPSNHRRGRIVETRLPEDCEELLQRRRDARRRNLQDIEDAPVPIGRSNRFHFPDRFGDDDV